MTMRLNMVVKMVGVMDMTRDMKMDANFMMIIRLQNINFQSNGEYVESTNKALWIRL